MEFSFLVRKQHCHDAFRDHAGSSKRKTIYLVHDGGQSKGIYDDFLYCFYALLSYERLSRAIEHKSFNRKELLINGKHLCDSQLSVGCR